MARTTGDHEGQPVNPKIPWVEVASFQATALQLQASYQVSTMINQMNGVTLRIVSATRPHEAAVVIDPSLEDAYLLATGKQAVRV